MHRYHNNHIGTPQELTDDDGNVIWANYEFAWGGTYQNYYQEQVLNGTIIDKDLLQPIKFQGQSLDIETGLHYNRFRYYDSDVGMFIGRDPIGLLGGYNVFAYAPNPTGWVDVLGLATDNEPLTENNCRALMTIIAHEEQYGKFSTIANYTANFTQNALALDADFPSIGGQVSIDWMIRSSAFGAGTIPPFGHLVYSAAKITWNTANMTNPFLNIGGEANFNAPTALNAWYYHSDMSLRKMFAPSIEICQQLCNQCNKSS